MLRSQTIPARRKTWQSGVASSCCAGATARSHLSECRTGPATSAAVAALDAEPASAVRGAEFVTIGRHIPKNLTAAVQPLFNDPMIEDCVAMKISPGRSTPGTKQKGDAADPDRHPRR